ncbi:MAG: hypothetical protein IT427_01270 [Pirellulales bacterium]|nr:hypothetical protein [Pirellulales bacterium]
MLQFHRTAGTPPNYLAWREQRKLLLWVLLIGLPPIAVLRVVDRWRAAELDSQNPAADAAPIDPRLPTPSPALPALGAFTIEPEQRENNQQNNRIDDRYFRGVMPNYLESVRDDTPSRPADQDACLNLLQVLHRATDAELKQASLGLVTYVQLFRQPEVYRGRLVDLRGTVRRAHPIPLPKNQSGLTQYYQLWLFTKDSGTNPFIVYALDLPAGFPIGTKLREPVELTGFFFKRVAYSAAGGGMTAPMLLAKTVAWNGAALAEKADANEKLQTRMKWTLGIAVVTAIALVGAMWQLNRTMRRPFIRRAEMSAEAASALQDADLPTVEDQLQRLAREQS